MRYVGWGGLPQAFDGRNAEWTKEYRQLLELLPSSDYEAARRSTQDAHYTGQTVVEGMYAGLARLGFAGGRTVEPAVGSGNFLGLMPAEMRSASEITGIELDPLSAGIAGALYPSAAIINRGYQDVRVPDGYFDLAIGNVPFGNQTLYDPEHEDLSRFSIHNYFLAKTLEKVRPGGVMAFVVSRHFLDSVNPQVREHIADRAHFLGAIRLPNTAFKRNALTEVTADIVFLQRADAGEVRDRLWVESVPMPGTEGENEIRINRWYAERPEQMLGIMTRGSAHAHGDGIALVERDGADLAADLRTAIEALPAGQYVPIERSGTAAEREAIAIPAGTKIGGYFMLDDGRTGRRLPDVLQDHDYEWVTPRNDKALERIHGMVAIRGALRELITAEQQEWTDDAELAPSRAALNRIYDRFVAKHGYLSSQANRLAMGDDPEYPLLQALEVDYDRGLGAEAAKNQGVEPRKPSASKAAIFERRVIRPRRRVERAETARDALVVVMNERGRVDLDHMARITGKSEEDLVRDLDGLIFLNPESQRWDTRDKYLTGNVKEKLEHAITAAGTDARFHTNVAALRAVQPADIEPVDIAVQLGSSWVPADDVKAFVRHLIGDVHCQVSFQPSIGRWVSKIGAGSRTVCRVQWGTEDKPANTLIEDILGNRDIKVLERAGTNPQTGAPIYVVNEPATAAAAQKADEIRQAFADWIWDDKERRDRLARIYNDRFNTNVAPAYDGTHLELPGSSPLIQLRDHQKNVIWRAIQEGSTLYDHCVGAGKTYEMAATAIESKRMGLMSKPMFVVPNHLLLQWKDAFYALYPGCNILVAEKTDFEKDNRQRLFSRIATGDWDAVVVAHSSFKKISMPPEMLEGILHEQINDLSDAIIQLKQEGGDRLSIKEMEKIKERMSERLKRAAETGGKDQVVTFADLGVDAVFVDELHEFKNLFISTSLSRISGLGNLAGSEKAFDMFVKLRYIQEKNGGRGVFGGTGTPISNTIAEMYTLQRYFQYKDLKRRGLVHFDEWAGTFGQVVSGWELDATGVNYKLNSRFAKFQNVPELVAMYRTFADVVTKIDLDNHAREHGERPLTPPVKGGKPRNVIVERSDQQAWFMGIQQTKMGDDGRPIVRGDGSEVRDWNEGSIIWRMENLPKDPSLDNPLKITNEARKAGLDFRLIEPDAADFEGSKVNHALAEIFDIWQRWDERQGTQLVFCDLSTPKGGRSAPVRAAGAGVEEVATEGEEPVLSMDELLSAGGRFSVYDDIKRKLIERGVPEEHIRFIHDAKTDVQKAKLFAEMNRGDIRILIGSTAKMGPGMNVQRRLVAEHHLDAPWRPSDLEQREGRIIRQGNLFYEEDPENFAVEIIRYATKQTYDSRMWQTIEYKARGIEEFRRGDSLQRVIEDVASEAANAADMKAAASGNPLILLQVQISSELKKVEAAHANWKRSRYTLENQAVWLERADIRADAEVAEIRSDIARRDANTTEDWQFAACGRRFGPKDRADAAMPIVTALKAAVEAGKKREVGEPLIEIPIGKYRGFEISVSANPGAAQFTLRGDHDLETSSLCYRAQDEFSVTGFFTRVDNVLDRLEAGMTTAETRRRNEHAEFGRVRSELGKPFALEDRLKALREDAGAVLTELRKIQADANYVSVWLPTTVPVPEDLAVAVEAAKAAGHGQTVGAEEAWAQKVVAAVETAARDPEGAEAAFVGLCEIPEDQWALHAAKLGDAFKQNRVLAERCCAEPMRHLLPGVVDEAASRATGYWEEERALAYAAGRMIHGRYANPSGVFDGEVLGVSDRCVLQETAPGFAVLHRFCDLDARHLEEGQQIRVRYHASGAAHVTGAGGQSLPQRHARQGAVER